MKLTEDQNAGLAELADLDRAYKQARKEALAALEESLEPLAIRRGMKAYELREAGVPVTQIAEKGMGTKATRTAYDAIELGARFAVPVVRTAAIEQPEPEGAFADAGDDGGFSFTYGEDVAFIVLADGQFDLMGDFNGAASAFFGEDDKWRLQAREWMGENSNA